MMRLQLCVDCGAAQYPAREFCGTCLSDRMAWQQVAALPGRLLAQTVLHHSNEPAFRARLPLRVGLVLLDAGPVAVCFVAGAASRTYDAVSPDRAGDDTPAGRDAAAAADAAVMVTINADGLLEAS